jgi:hypothetical protein
LDSAAAEVSSSPIAVEFTAFVDGWEKVLDRVHCAEVLKSIKNFAGAAHALYWHQSDELRVACRVRKCSRELDGKSQMLRQGASRCGGRSALSTLWGTVGVDGDLMSRWDRRAAGGGTGDS